MNRRFLAIIAVFLALGAVMVGFGIHYHGKFGSAIGRIVEHGSGRPVVGAWVKIQGIFHGKVPTAQNAIEIERTAETRADGTFTLPETVGGEYQLIVSVEKNGARLPIFEKTGVNVARAAVTDLGTIEVPAIP